jgi:hypothetical protein
MCATPTWTERRAMRWAGDVPMILSANFMPASYGGNPWDAG